MPAFCGEDMNVESMLKQLDELFDTGKIKEVEGFLKEKLGEAKAEADGGAMLTILNEQIGYYRVMTQYDKALDTIGEIKSKKQV